MKLSRFFIASISMLMYNLHCNLDTLHSLINVYHSSGVVQGVLTLDNNKIYGVYDRESTQHWAKNHNFLSYIALSCIITSSTY